MKFEKESKCHETSRNGKKAKGGKKTNLHLYLQLDAMSCVCRIPDDLCDEIFRSTNWEITRNDVIAAILEGPEGWEIHEFHVGSSSFQVNLGSFQHKKTKAQIQAWSRSTFEICKRYSADIPCGKSPFDKN